MNEREIVARLSAIGICGNVLLSAFKLLAGIFGGSAAMISDAVHSFSDVAATAIAAVGVRLSEKKADAKHPYGHERFECIASLALGLILAVTGLAIGWSSLRKIISGSYASIAAPTMLPLIAAAVSIICKEAMFRYTMHYAKVLDSSAFKADAWHHRSDALSSVGALIGIAGARLGCPIMEPLAGVVICAFILKVAYDVAETALVQVLDTSGSPRLESELRSFIEAQEGVHHIDILHTRQFGSRVYVDVDISVEGSLTLIEAHAIAENLHRALESSFPQIKHVMIHENPDGCHEDANE